MPSETSVSPANALHVTADYVAGISFSCRAIVHRMTVQWHEPARGLARLLLQTHAVALHKFDLSGVAAQMSHAGQLQAASSVGSQAAAGCMQPPPWPLLLLMEERRDMSIAGSSARARSGKKRMAFAVPPDAAALHALSLCFLCQSEEGLLHRRGPLLLPSSVHAGKLQGSPLASSTVTSSAAG